MSIQCVEYSSLEEYYCPIGTSCSEYGCVLPANMRFTFTSSSRLVWTNTVIQLCILIAGFIGFIAYTIYYRMRRSRIHSTLSHRNKVYHAVNTEDDLHYINCNRNTETCKRCCSEGIDNTFLCVAHQESHCPNKLYSNLLQELDGHCCGCGEVANVILLPCQHVICCHKCGEKALYCPLCQRQVVNSIKLYAC